jgi:hypothetical protein
MTYDTYLKSYYYEYFTFTGNVAIKELNTLISSCNYNLYLATYKHLTQINRKLVNTAACRGGKREENNGFYFG